MGLRRPFEPWKVRAWQRHRCLRPTGRVIPVRVRLWLLILMILAKAVRLMMLLIMVRVRGKAGMTLS
jgi:hypothetical protein